tara:strand:+ start:82 stop:660 length:579 start_codon:yes stop_codon:yes gene_type:complete
MEKEIIIKNLLNRATKSLKQNLKTFIVLSIVLFTFLFGFIFHLNNQEKKNIAIAEEYTSASILIKQKKIKESQLLLEAIIKKDHQFYSPLALYLLIDSNIERDSSKIIGFFDKILKNNSINEENLNLIKIKKSIYLIHLDNERLIIETLNPVINSNSVWKNMAINLISQYFLSKNQTVKAEEYIQLLNKEIN